MGNQELWWDSRERVLKTACQLAQAGETHEQSLETTHTFLTPAVVSGEERGREVSPGGARGMARYTPPVEILDVLPLILSHLIIS